MKKLISTVFTLLICIAAFALNPSKTYSVLPSDFGMDYKEVSIPTEDGMHLCGWVFKPSAESKKYIIMSGNGDGNMADNIEIASSFLSLQYNVIMYDYRGYGKSDSFKINTNFYIYSQFLKDLQGVLDWTRKNGSTTFDLYGRGIGAGLSIGVACNRSEVHRVIADSPYSTLDGMKTRIKEKQSKDVLMPLGYDKTWMEPTYALPKGEHLFGIMYISGATDELVTADDIKALLNIRTKNAVSYSVPAVKSDATFSSNKDEYFKQIKKFVEGHAG